MRTNKGQQSKLVSIKNESSGKFRRIPQNEAKTLIKEGSWRYASKEEWKKAGRPY